MKKFVKFGILATIIVVALFSISGGAQAQTVSPIPVISACPVGYVCGIISTTTPTTPIPVISACPVGYICTGTAPLTISQSGSVYTGTTFSLKAVSSDMQVNSISVDFSVRPWLYFSSFSLVNQTTGQVLYTANSFDQSNFVEYSVGSDYRFMFNGLNFTIPRGQTVNVVLTGQAIPSVNPNATVIYAIVRATDSSGVSQTATTNGNTNPPIPISDATVTVQGTPTLALTYDANRKESSLTATFNISVNGRTSGINVGYGSSITFSNSTNPAQSAYPGGSMTPTFHVDTIQDNNGQTLWVVPPGTSRTFRIIAKATPSQMFAGTYYASLNAIFGVVGTSNLNNGNVVKLIPGPNRSLPKTIVGETSPYITSIKPTNISVGQTVTIMGQRLGGTTLMIDGVPTGILLTPVNSYINMGTGLTFTLPNLINGYHNLQLSSKTTGLSNMMGFNVQGSSRNSVLAALDPSSPVTGTVQISRTTPTTVAIAIFDLKSQGGTPSTLQGIQFGLNQYMTSVGTLITNATIRVGSQTYFASATEKDGLLIFNNLQIPLPADVTIPIVVSVIVAPDNTGSLSGSNASVNLPLNGINVIDANYNQVPVNQGPVVGLLSGSTITFTSGAAQLSQTNTSISTVSCNTNGYCFQPVTFGFTLTAGNDPVYLSTSVTDTGTLAPNSSIVFGAKGFIVPSKGSLLAKGSAAGDATAYFLIAPGSSRSFGFSGILDNSYCPPGYGCSNMVSQIAAINYGTSANNLSSYSISTGLENLRVTVSFPASTTTPPIVICTGYTFSTNLQLGNTGADVVALQTYLISAGYSIPNIMNGSTAKGTFDSQTAAAVSAFQTANGIPETGFVGPLTRAKLNACPVTPPTTVGCPVGYICTPLGGTTVCPAGYVCTNVITNCPNGYTCYSATPAVTTPSIDSFTISPITRGGSATLSWRTTGMQSCTIDSAGNTVLNNIFGSLLGVVKGANDSVTVTIPATVGLLNRGTTGTIELGCYTGANLTGTYVPKTVTVTIPPVTSVIPATTTNITAAIWDAIREYFAAGGR